MLAAGALIWLAAATAAPFEGGLGLRFDSPLAAEAKGASMTPAPLPIDLLTDEGLDQAYLHLGWHHIVPSVLPARLRDREDLHFYAQLDTTGWPVRIVAELGRSCDGLFSYLSSLLAKKYGDGATRSEHWLRWQTAGQRLDLVCDSNGWLVFTNELGDRSWQAIAEDRVAQAEQLTKIGLKLRANRFTLGTNRKLEGAFGASFVDPFPGYLDLPHDEAFAIQLAQDTPPYDTGTFELTLAPSGEAVQIVGEFDELDIDGIKPILSAKYGAPAKDTPRHVIYRVGGDFAVLRQTRKGLRMNFTSKEGMRKLRIRAKESAAAAFEDEASGL